MDKKSNNMNTIIIIVLITTVVCSISVLIAAISSGSVTSIFGPYLPRLRTTYIDDLVTQAETLSSRLAIEKQKRNKNDYLSLLNTQMTSYVKKNNVVKYGDQIELSITDTNDTDKPTYYLNTINIDPTNTKCPGTYPKSPQLVYVGGYPDSPAYPLTVQKYGS